MTTHNTAYICGYYNFPRGSASANYVQYLALALEDIGYNVVLITNINKDEVSYFRKQNMKMVLDGYEIAASGIKHFWDFNFGMGRYICSKLSNYDIQKNDLLISYSTDFSINKCLLNIAKMKDAIAIACVVELFESKDFTKGKRSIRFWNYWFTHYKIINQYNLIFPISTYIEDFYKNKGCNVCRLPIMTNPYEFPYCRKKKSGIRRFIYPAHGKIKDSVEVMFKSLSYMSEDELNQMELHICGLSRDSVENMLPEKLKKRIDGTIIVHNWMKYDDLISLYKNMDFLILVREISQMTLANFPSKVPEVMSYGVIPIVSRVGDYTSLYLNDGVDSLIFDGNGSKECAMALKRSLLLSDEQIDMLSQNSFDCAASVFYYKNWTTKIKEAINNCGIHSVEPNKQ